jgi:hypothetical protein
MTKANVETTNLRWRKAKYSIGNGECVEVAHAKNRILVRDSRDERGLVIRYPRVSWEEFLQRLKKN